MYSVLGNGFLVFLYHFLIKTRQRIDDSTQIAPRESLCSQSNGILTLISATSFQPMAEITDNLLSPKQYYLIPKRKKSRIEKLLTRNLPTPDPKFLFEEIARDLQEVDLSRHGVSTIQEYSTATCNRTFTGEIDIVGSKEPPPLYPVCWGWNSGGRAGNLTEVEINHPRQVQKSSQHNYIGSAAGKSHSLLVSDDGNVFSFGEGKYGQLGYGNQFNAEEIRAETTQAYPKAVTPSGEYVHGRDIKVVQVGCGTTFSIARELCPSEGMDLKSGVIHAERALSDLLETHADSDTLLRVASEVRQERFSVSKISSGVVTSWGTGNHGELGLGKYVTFSPSPQLIPRFKSLIIVQIAVGPQHVLALNSEKKLFSWGKGSKGRLGLGDFNDRYAPEYVSFYEDYEVEYCAAGEAHSAVLISTVSMKSDGSSARLKSLATFGCGYHGRLGNGTNRNCCIPVDVTEWLPSLKDLQILQVACGGSHTLALLERHVPIDLANPW